MRDAADKLAEALQPLRLLQPPFETLPVGFGTQPLPFRFGGQPLGDVTDRHHHLGPGCGRQRADADLNGQFPAILIRDGPPQALT